MFNASKAYELNLLVSGRAITEYEHQGNIFVEGRKGSEFEVEFKNKTAKRVLVVPSVDGKSVIDGKTATVESKGYIVDPWKSIKIPGWTLDHSAVAKFTFEDKEKSYAAAIATEGESVQSGVVGVIVFNEVEKPQAIHHHHYHTPTYVPRGPSVPINPWGPTWTSTCNADTIGSAADVKDIMRSKSVMNATLSASASATTSSISNPAPLDNPFEMGAGFGDKANFRTQEGSFDRGTMVATMLLFYDSRRNLEKRGIEVVKKDTRHINELPQAFAGIGCTPPPGWQG